MCTSTIVTCEKPEVVKSPKSKFDFKFGVRKRIRKFPPSSPSSSGKHKQTGLVDGDSPDYLEYMEAERKKKGEKKEETKQGK